MFLFYLGPLQFCNDFITSNWIYGSIVGSFLLSGWAMNYQRGELMNEINELKDRIIELELASKQE